MLIFYSRVSTRDQTVAHQLIQAREAGFAIEKHFSDEGVSGVSVPLADRPGGKLLLAALCPGDTLIVRWLDRLGRNYLDVTETVRGLLKEGIIIRTIVNNLTFDGTSGDTMKRCMNDTLLSVLAAMASMEIEAKSIAQRAGIEHARNCGKPNGRKPSFTRSQLDTVKRLLSSNMTMIDIANATGLLRQTIYRIKDDPAAAEVSLARWSGEPVEKDDRPACRQSAASLVSAVRRPRSTVAVPDDHYDG